MRTFFSLHFPLFIVWTLAWTLFPVTACDRKAAARWDGEAAKHSDTPEARTSHGAPHGDLTMTPERIREILGPLRGSYLLTLSPAVHPERVELASGRLALWGSSELGTRGKPWTTRLRHVDMKTVTSAPARTTEHRFPGRGPVFALRSGFVHLVSEKMAPAKDSLVEWSRVKVRFYGKGGAAVGAGVPLTVRKLSADPGVRRMAIFEEKDRVAVFWNGSLNRWDQATQTVRVRFFSPTTGQPLGPEQLFKKVTGVSATGVPAFFKGARTTYIVFHDEEYIRVASFSRLGPLAPWRIAHTGLISYFPADVRGMEHAGGDVSVCWQTWEKRSERLFKKQLWCRRFSAQGKARASTQHLTPVRAAPHAHKQFFEQDLELYIDDVALTEDDAGRLLVLYSLKDLSERAFAPLGIFERTIDTRGRLSGTLRLALKTPRTEYLEVRVVAARGTGTAGKLLYSAWLPSLGTSYYLAPLRIPGT